MNKLAVVLGVAAVATITGCRNPEYVRKGHRAPANQAKSVETTPAKPVEQAPAAKPEKKLGCTCKIGTVHNEPCKCGAADCACIVEKKVVAKPAAPAPAPVAVKPAAPESYVYVVQNGDSLSRISKRYNVKVSAIKSANGLKGDGVRIGQKLKLPGVTAEAAASVAAAKPVKKAAVKSAVKAAAKPYTGAVFEYVVKNGDTLGAIAYANKSTIRQLKELNGLSKDSLSVGQKLKVPVAKASDTAKVAKPVEDKAAKPVEAKAAKPAEVKPVPVAAEVKPEAAADAAPAEKVVDKPAEVKSEEVKPEAPKFNTYTVQEGDDMTSVSISWGVSAAAIRELNGLADADQLKPGQVIKLPADAQQ